MRISYEPQDIQDMARLVAQEIMPLLVAEIREAARLQAPPPRTEPTPDATRSALSDVVSSKELRRITGLSETTLWRLAQSGNLPPKRRLSPKRIGYLRSEVNAWLESRG